MNDDGRPTVSGETILIEDLVAEAGLQPEFEEAKDALEGAALVRQMRKLADGGQGITQDELARRLGVTQARISTLEKGDYPRGPTFVLLKRVARACKVDWPAPLLARDTGEREPESMPGDRQLRSRDRL